MLKQETRSVGRGSFAVFAAQDDTTCALLRSSPTAHIFVLISVANYRGGRTIWTESSLALPTAWKERSPFRPTRKKLFRQACNAVGWGLTALGRYGRIDFG